MDQGPGKIDRVAVIIPAYNAAETIEATLRSARRQTYADLEIVVVDDGSQDDTASLVRAQAASDRRVRLLAQKNAGVGAARNHGIEQTSGGFIATLDADDLWSPQKIEWQLKTYRRAGHPLGLVYAWSANIDAAGYVINQRCRPRADGDVLKRISRGNFIANASSALIPRQVILQCGGFDELLHARGVPGCEDFKLYWQIAEHYQFACVPAFLTGYRIRRDSMSNAWRRMLGSFDAVTGEMALRRPEFAGQFRRGRADMLKWFAVRAIRAGDWLQAWAFLEELRRSDATCYLGALAGLPLRGAHGRADEAVRRIRRALGEAADFLAAPASGESSVAHEAGE